MADAICPNCLYRGAPRLVTPGSIAIELVLWIAFCVPGLIYSIWRLTARYQACPACGAPHMIPTTTPRGAQLLAQAGQTPAGQYEAAPLAMSPESRASGKRRATHQVIAGAVLVGIGGAFAASCLLFRDSASALFAGVIVFVPAGLAIGLPSIRGALKKTGP